MFVVMLLVLQNFVYFLTARAAPSLQPWSAYLGLSDRCPMAENPAAAVKKALKATLIGQDHGTCSSL
jgi:hypothetical protein